MPLLLLKDVDFILKGFDLSELGSLDDHDVIGMTHPFYGLSRKSINVCLNINVK